MSQSDDQQPGNEPKAPPPGTVVQLASGGPPMTLACVDENGTAECWFWDLDNTLKVKDFPAGVLILYTKR